MAEFEDIGYSLIFIDCSKVYLGDRMLLNHLLDRIYQRVG